MTPPTPQKKIQKSKQTPRNLKSSIQVVLGLILGLVELDFLIPALSTFLFQFSSTVFFFLTRFMSHSTIAVFVGGLKLVLSSLLSLVVLSSIIL